MYIYTTLIHFEHYATVTHIEDVGVNSRKASLPTHQYQYLSVIKVNGILI